MYIKSVDKEEKVKVNADRLQTPHPVHMNAVIYYQLQRICLGFGDLGVVRLPGCLKLGTVKRVIFRASRNLVG